MQAVGDAFNAGFYEEQVQLRSLPLLESRPKRFMRNISAKDAISSKKVNLSVDISTTQSRLLAEIYTG